MKNMKIRRMLGCVALAVCCMMIGSAMTLNAHPTAQAEETQTVVVTSPFTAAVAKVKDSVVGVNNYQIQRYGSYGDDWSDYFGFGFGYGFGRDNGRDRQTEEREVLTSTGSGVVIGEGLVLTNYHVVEDASTLKISITEEGEDEATELPASLVTYDENLDIAIVYAPSLEREAVALGDSDTLQVGDWAICIGNPLSFTNTTTVGVVSALNRGIESESYDRYGRRETIVNAMIQTDAAINAGNSGGGMFSVTGELMGIPTLKYTGSYYSGSTVENIGMCIPINTAKPLIEQVLSGQITPTAPAESTDETTSTTSTSLSGKPRLGITISNLNTSNTYVRSGRVPMGAYVSEVEKNSPAEKAGIQVGDIIVDVNDTVISSSSDLTNAVGQYDAGETLNIKLFRVPGGLDSDSITSDDIDNGEYIDLQVTLALIDQTT